MGNKKYEIGFKKSILSTINAEGQDLIAFHEMGHVFLWHTEMLITASMAETVELKADYFAAFLYKRWGRINQGLMDFLEVMSKKDTVPSGAERARIFRSIILP